MLSAEGSRRDRVDCHSDGATATEESGSSPFLKMNDGGARFFPRCRSLRMTRLRCSQHSALSTQQFPNAHPPRPIADRRLHLGNARTFLINWLLARQNGWRIVLRIEDLDGPRIKRGADRRRSKTSAGSASTGTTARSTSRPACPLPRGGGSAARRRPAYPCVCSRKEVEQAASAPHAEDGAAVYPGTCRGRFATVDAARAAGGREPAIRFRVAAGRSSTGPTPSRGPQRCDAARSSATS